jgi:hypothetical protein
MTTQLDSGPPPASRPTGTVTFRIALLLAMRGEVHESARLIGYVTAQLKEVASERETTEKWGYDKLMAALREQLSDAEIEQLRPKARRGLKNRPSKKRSRFSCLRLRGRRGFPNLGTLPAIAEIGVPTAVGG